MWVFSAKVREQRHFSSHTSPAFKRASLGRLLLKKEQLRMSTFLEKCVLFAPYHNPPVAQGPWFCSGVTDYSAVIGCFPERLGLVQWRDWEVDPETAKNKRARGTVRILPGPCQGSSLEELKSGSSALNMAPGVSTKDLWIGFRNGWKVKERVGGDGGRPGRSPVLLALGRQVGFPNQV